jgi:hypothetical protein
MARAVRVAAVLAGCVAMAYGSWGLFLSHAVPHSANLLVWLAASLLGHDGVIAPVVFALCWAGTRLLPPRAKPWAAGVLLVGGTTFLVGLAALLGRGRDSNPTVLPLDYGRNILAVLLAVVLGAAAAAGGTAAIRAARRAIGPRHATAPDRGAQHHAGTPWTPMAQKPRSLPTRLNTDREHQEDRKHHENQEHSKDRAHHEHRADDAPDPNRRQRGNHPDERQL